MMDFNSHQNYLPDVPFAVPVSFDLEQTTPECQTSIKYDTFDFSDNQLILQVRKMPRVFVPVITPGTAKIITRS
jgi:hypothetical protein